MSHKAIAPRSFANKYKHISIYRMRVTLKRSTANRIMPQFNCKRCTYYFKRSKLKLMVYNLKLITLLRCQRAFSAWSFLLICIDTYNLI